MAELVDAADSKSVSSDRVPVQVRMGAPLFEMVNILFPICFYVTMNMNEGDFIS